MSAATLTTTSGDLTVSVHDATVLTAYRRERALRAVDAVVTLASTEARNTSDRTVEAALTTVTATVAAGHDTFVSALSDGRVLAWTEAVAIKFKTNTVPTSSAKALAATLAANVILGSVSASVTGSTLTGARDVAVTASNAAFIDATGALSAIATTDTDAISFKFILSTAPWPWAPRSPST